MVLSRWRDVLLIPLEMARCGSSLSSWKPESFSPDFTELLETFPFHGVYEPINCERGTFLLGLFENQKCRYIKIKRFAKMHLVWFMYIHFLTEKWKWSNMFCLHSILTFCIFQIKNQSFFQNEKWKFQRFLDFMLMLFSIFWTFHKISQFSKRSKASFHGGNSIVTRIRDGLCDLPCALPS